MGSALRSRDGKDKHKGRKRKKLAGERAPVLGVGGREKIEKQQNCARAAKSRAPPPPHVVRAASSPSAPAASLPHIDVHAQTVSPGPTKGDGTRSRAMRRQAEGLAALLGKGKSVSAATEALQKVRRDGGTGGAALERLEKEALQDDPAHQIGAAVKAAMAESAGDGGWEEPGTEERPRSRRAPGAAAAAAAAAPGTGTRTPSTHARQQNRDAQQTVFTMISTVKSKAKVLSYLGQNHGSGWRDSDG
jgi:hypothetical protein